MSDGFSIIILLLAATGPLFFVLLPALRRLPFSRILPILPAMLALLVSQSFSIQVPLLASQITLGFGTNGKWILGCTILLWLVVLATINQQRFKLDYVFVALFMLTIASSVANVVTHSLLAFYLFFTLIGYACYGLLIQACGKPVQRAAKIYLILQIFGDLIIFELCLVLATKVSVLNFTSLSPAFVAPETQGLILGLALLGIIAKAGIWPLHFWLPMVFRCAPVSIMILLGIILPSTAMFGWFNLFSELENVTTEWPDRMQIMGLASLFYSVVVGLTQKHPGSVLAYVLLALESQLTIVFGNFLSRPVGVDYPSKLLILPIIHYALSGTALVLSMKLAAPATRRFARFWIWLIPVCVCLTGTAFIATMISVRRGMGITGLEILSLTALTLLLVRFGYLVQTYPKIKSAKLFNVLAILQTGLVMLTLASLSYWLNSLTAQGLAIPELRPAAAALLAGLFIGFSIWKLFKRWKILEYPHIPPGDFVVPLEYLANTIRRRGYYFSRRTLPALKAQFLTLIGFPWKANQLLAAFKNGEKNLQHWRTAIILMLSLGLTLGGSPRIENLLRKSPFWPDFPIILVK